MTESLRGRIGIAIITILIVGMGILVILNESKGGGTALPTDDSTISTVPLPIPSESPVVVEPTEPPTLPETTPTPTEPPTTVEPTETPTATETPDDTAPSNSYDEEIQLTLPNFPHASAIYSRETAPTLTEEQVISILETAASFAEMSGTFDSYSATRWDSLQKAVTTFGSPALALDYSESSEIFLTPFEDWKHMGLKVGSIVTLASIQREITPTSVTVFIAYKTAESTGTPIVLATSPESYVELTLTLTDSKWLISSASQIEGSQFFILPEGSLVTLQ